MFGFIAGILKKGHDTDEVFAAVSERLWRSLPAFRWRCSLRTWAYVITRREVTRFRSGQRRHDVGRVPISQVEDVIAAATTQARATHRSAERREKLESLREELPVDDRMLFVLRLDRNMSWDEIALVFAADAATCGDDERKREAARCRKRYQLIKDRLTRRARDEGLL